MFTRIGLMLVVLGTLCSAAFHLGSKSSALGQDPSGIPSGHPLALALRYRRELALTDEQIQKLGAMQQQMATEFAPLHEQAEGIQHQMEELQQSGKPDPAAGAELKQKGDALSAKIQPLFERYAQQVGKLLSQEQIQKLMKLSEADGKPTGESDFVLNTIIQSRDSLEITPQQFTKLQYLQADFIRAYAPLREKMELLELEMKDKFGKTGQPPTQEYADRQAEIKKQFLALQSQVSGQAIENVLTPAQRSKLKELLNGEHRSAPTGG